MILAIRKTIGLLKQLFRKIGVALSIALFGLGTGIVVAVPLDKLEYSIIMTADGFPVIWSKNSYGFPEKIPQTELLDLEYCSSSAGCSPEALAKGAVYFRVYTVAGKQVIAYYDANGKLVATQKGGKDSPVAATIPASPIKLPKVNVSKFSRSEDSPVGYLESEFAVSDSGAATYNIPIALPPGTAGVQPDVSLSYSSQSGESIAGQGWSISGLSAISRCGKTIAQDGVIAGIKFDNTDNFCMDGQRLIRISGSNGANKSKYRTEIDSYSEITAYDSNGDKSPEYFEVKTKAGEIHSFGKTEKSRVERFFIDGSTLSNSDEAFTWAINRTEDLLGNYIDYEYTETNDPKRGLNHRIKKIKYTGNHKTGLAPYLSVNFSYKKKKAQEFKGYLSGSNIYRYSLLSNISVEYGTSKVREYKLAYHEVDSNAVAKQDHLKSVQECSGSRGVTCLPATYFTWDGAYDSDGTGGSTPKTGARGVYVPTNADLSGDSTGEKKFTNWARINEFEWTRSDSKPVGRISPDYNQNNSTKLVGDVNGDGISDIVGARFAGTGKKSTLGVLFERKTAIEVGLGVKDINGGRLDMTSFDTSKANGITYGIGTGKTSLYPYFLADVNGDGKSDLVQIANSSVRVNLSDGNKFLTRKSSLQEGQFSKSKGWESGKHPRFVQDINGDGKADIIGINQKGVSVALSTGTGFATPVLWTKNFNTSGSFSTGRSDFGGIDYTNDGISAELADVSGDGLPDLIVHHSLGTKIAINKPNNPVNRKFELLNTKIGFDSTRVFAGYDLKNPLRFGVLYGSPPIADGSTIHTPKLMGDVNGDGNLDIVTFSLGYDKNSGVYVAYGTGTGFLPYEFKLSEFVPYDYFSKKGWNGHKHPRHLVDVNADGKADILGFDESGVVVSLSTGNGFEKPIRWSSNFGNAANTWNYDKNNFYSSYNPLRTFGDFNGDGLVDILGIDSVATYITENKAEPLRITRINAGGFVPNGADPMAHHGLDRSIAIEYEKLTAKGKYSVYTKGKGLQPALFVVKAHSSSNGSLLNNQELKARMSYTYEGFDVDREGRGSKGFKRRTVRDHLSDIVTSKEYYQDYPLTGQSRLEETKLAKPGKAEKLLKRKETKLASTPPLGKTGTYYTVYTEKEVESDYTLASSKLYKTTSTIPNKPDVCGNITRLRTETVDVLKAKENYSKTTTSVFPTKGSCFARSRLSSSKVVSTNGTVSKTRNVKFTYLKGQIRTEEIEPGNALSSKTSYVYDAYGNVTRKTISATGQKSRRIDTAYDSKGRFAVRITNAKGHVEKRGYDLKLGLVTTVTDTNGLTSRTYYNQKAQKYLTVSPTNAWAHTIYEWHNTLTHVGSKPEHKNKSRYRTITKTSEGGESRTYYDQLDRVVRTETKGLNGKYISKDKVYNQRTGELYKESLPYFSGLPESQKKWVKYTYDDLERPASIQQPGQAASAITYNGLETKTKDALRRFKTQRNNVLGKPDWVKDHRGNEVRYFYTAEGNLEKTINIAIDKPNSVTEFTYDRLGNKTKMIDPDMGTWSYRYNAFGELIWQRNANNNTISMTYDTLGRLLSRKEKEGTTRWVYDTAPGKGIGKLHTVSAPLGYRKTHRYSNLGQVAEVEEELPNSTKGGGTTSYITRSSYDASGRPDIITYPQSDPSRPAISVRHRYDDNSGALEQITNASTKKPYWTARAIDQFGNVSDQVLGNGVVTLRTHDYLGRLTNIKSGRGGGTGLQSLRFKYDDLGNITNREDLRIKVAESFKYDTLNRLIKSTSSYQGVNARAKHILYDGHGNIVVKNGKAYTYGSSKTHAVTDIGGDKYTYDTNGNMLKGAGRTISWTSFDKPIKISKGENTLELAYGADHQRILKHATTTDKKGANKDTWYIGGGLVERERITSGDDAGKETHKFNLRAGGQTVGYITQHKSKEDVWTAQNSRYLLTDHLGSIDVVTNARGTKLQKLSFDSWGKRRNAAWQDIGDTELARTVAALNQESINRGFTGHEMDDEVGLINMKGRLYDADIGRFISADPHVQAPTDTQSFNRYTYVKNNPLSYTDPSGYFFKKLFKKIGKFFKKWGRTLLAIAATIYTGGLAGGLLAGNAFGTIALSGLSLGKAIIAGAVGGFFGGAISTGSLKGALRGAVFGGISAGLANGIGHGFDGMGGIGDPGSLTRAVAHGVAQGTVSVLRGGKFGSGLVSGFASSVASPFIKGRDVFTKAVKHAVLGGTVSKLVGGKFANGAITAAFTYMFNDAAENLERDPESVGDPNPNSSQGRIIRFKVGYGKSKGWFGWKHTNNYYKYKLGAFATTRFFASPERGLESLEVKAFTGLQFLPQTGRGVDFTMGVKANLPIRDFVKPHFESYSPVHTYTTQQAGGPTVYVDDTFHFKDFTLNIRYMDKE